MRDRNRLKGDIRDAFCKYAHYRGLNKSNIMFLKDFVIKEGVLERIMCREERFNDEEKMLCVEMFGQLEKESLIEGSPQSRFTEKGIKALDNGKRSLSNFVKNGLGDVIVGFYYRGENKVAISQAYIYVEDEKFRKKIKKHVSGRNLSTVGKMCRVAFGYGKWVKKEYVWVSGDFKHPFWSQQEASGFVKTNFHVFRDRVAHTTSEFNDVDTVAGLTVCQAISDLIDGMEYEGVKIGLG